MPDLPEGQQPAEPTGQPKGTSRFYTEEELRAAQEAARKEEKDKLYPTLNRADERSKAMEDELKELRKFQKSQEKIQADRQKAIDDAQKAKEEAELSAKELVERRNAEVAAQLEAMRNENANQIALMQKEVEFNKLQAHIQRRVNEESDNIAPELLDFIGGNSAEEVEASIERVKAKTAQILENMQAAGVRQRAAMPGVAPAGGTNGIGPMDQPGQRELTAEDINGMGMAEFAELRKRVGIGGAQNQGLFRT